MWFASATSGTMNRATVGRVPGSRSIAAADREYRVDWRVVDDDVHEPAIVASTEIVT
jgi:hypothetical protein